MNLKFKMCCPYIFLIEVVGYRPRKYSCRVGGQNHCLWWATNRADSTARPLQSKSVYKNFIESQAAFFSKWKTLSSVSNNFEFSSEKMSLTREHFGRQKLSRLSAIGRFWLHVPHTELIPQIGLIAIIHIQHLCDFVFRNEGCFSLFVFLNSLPSDV